MNEIFSMVSAAKNALKIKEVTIIIKGSRKDQISKRANKIKEVKTMKKSSRMTKILIVVVVLIISLTSTVAAEERFDSKILETKILESKILEGKTFDIQDTEKAKEIGTQMVGKIRETTEQYAQSNIISEYTRSNDQVLGKIVIRYEDVNGTLLDSKTRVGLKLGDYTETAIPIEGFELVGKGSYTASLTNEKYEWLIVFKYEKEDKDKDKEDPKEPLNPVDPTDPSKEEPKDANKEEPKQTEKPKASDSNATDSNNKQKAVATQAKLPKTGSPATALYLVGGFMTLSGGIILRKK